MTLRRRTVPVAIALAATLGCARILRPRPPAPTLTRAAMLDALAARERAFDGLRIAMSVHAGGAGALLASRVYLAITGPRRLRLQALSAFGLTALDLTVEDDEYELRLPLRNETRRGRIDPAALLRADAPAGERMIVALALLFRSKHGPTRCDRLNGAELRCAIGDDLEATITMDARGRPTRERIGRAGGTLLVIAEYADYPSAGTTWVPGRVVIRDVGGDASMTGRVIRAERLPPSA